MTTTLALYSCVLSTQSICTRPNLTYSPPLQNGFHAIWYAQINPFKYFLTCFLNSMESPSTQLSPFRLSFHKLCRTVCSRCSLCELLVQRRSGTKVGSQGGRENTKCDSRWRSHEGHSGNPKRESTKASQLNIQGQKTSEIFFIKFFIHLIYIDEHFIQLSTLPEPVFIVRAFPFLAIALR